MKSNKSYISALQVRAARGLLNWSQEVLAEASGISIATIRKLEAGNISPRDKTNEAIKMALEKSNVEFLSSGARLRDNDIVVLEGEEVYLQLLDEIYDTVRDQNSETLFFNVNPKFLSEKEIRGITRIKHAGSRRRFITEEGNTHLIFPIDEYRWISKKFYKRNVHVVFGNKVAVGCSLDKPTETTTKITIINSMSFAEATRNLFEFVWEGSRKPPYTTAHKIYE